MVKVILVDAMIEEGRELISALERAGIIVDLAYWSYLEEAGIYNLYLVANRSFEAMGRALYETIHRVIAEMPEGFSIESSEVGIAHNHDETARALRKYAKKYPNPKGHRVRRGLIENIHIEDAYIYPPTSIAAPR